jgi:heme/copper-type cytochrome/quinol oxidase subunit 4
LTATPSTSAIFQARLAAGLIVVLIVVGALWYGISFESLDRLWKDMMARPGGPMTFRFILQPAMAAAMALRDGVSDARLARRPYLWALLRGVRGPEGRAGRLWEGIVSTARILILGVIMDTIYQWVVFKTFYPVQATVIAVLLAFVPYLLLRGPFARIARHWIARPASR